MPTLMSLGGAGTVTGSRHLLQIGDTRILVDCGLFQGFKDLRERNWAPLGVPVQTIDAVILTHAHLDHSGYLPRLVKEGFRGAIYATSGTVDLAKLILLDSAHLQEKDAEFANRHGYSAHKPALPLYDTKDVEETFGLFEEVPLHVPVSLPGGARLSFYGAGHIIGAASARLEWADGSVLFSGDLGRYNDLVMKPPEAPRTADYVVIESTYGDRIHDATDPLQALGDVIERTVKRGGTVVIPAFAVGRAQSLLYCLWRLKEAGRLGLVPIYVDSPMATNATNIMCKHPEDHRLDEQSCRASCGVATYVRDVEASKELTAARYPKVIISASGMATGGRVLHHLKAFGGSSRNTILLSGFQAAGTRGRLLLDGARELKIHGDWVPIRAEVVDLPALSAHGDAADLTSWLSALPEPPKRVFVVHGEPAASAAFASRIEQQLGWRSHVLNMFEEVLLDQNIPRVQTAAE
ncbi:MBL fold metallo-hydrolase [Sphingomonas sp. ID1715]|uniref:MBL fold metallo-hydrolase RNA specificity domain-containing protein n=1 Tax=Sphingomonas sp. ID1715 TaxID=1656898 RepID=UPI0014891A52|nr:MBL fold metallo-hydrolase [Sphingomonas sp. ID1715]NNM77768.1 MBL fold metallo-hydrolase [Sphingomonas sp. ID1715]